MQLQYPPDLEHRAHAAGKRWARKFHAWPQPGSGTGWRFFAHLWLIAFYAGWNAARREVVDEATRDRVRARMSNQLSGMSSPLAGARGERTCC